MFRKAHLLFTLLCGGSTAAIMVIMSLFYLSVSEKSLYDNQFRSFQNDISDYRQSGTVNFGVHAVAGTNRGAERLLHIHSR